MASCGADWRGNRLGAAPINFARHRTSVSFGSLANITPLNGDVCFAPETGHRLAALPCPLSAISGHGRLFDHLISAREWHLLFHRKQKRDRGPQLSVGCAGRTYRVVLAGNLCVHCGGADVGINENSC